MAWFPIANTVPQYWKQAADGTNEYSGAVLKAYQVGTLTNIPFATDNTGGTTANSIALNANGHPEVSGNVVIPHLDQDYKLALYPDQASADADSGATWTIDNIDLFQNSVKDPEHATDGGTDAYVSANNTSPPGDGVVIHRDFQSASTTTTPTLDGKTMTTRDGSALWADAVSGVHELQYASGTDTYLVLDPLPIDEDDMASDSAAAVPTQQSVAAFVGAQKISSGSFSGASVDITLPTGYDQHILVVNALQPATDATNLQARLDSVSSANSYEYEALVADAGTVAAGRTLTTQMNLIEALSNASEEIATMTLEIYGARNTGARTMLQARSQYMASDSAINLRIHVAQRTAEEDDTILNLFMSSGNFSTGNYTLYGMR